MYKGARKIIYSEFFSTEEPIYLFTYSVRRINLGRIKCDLAGQATSKNREKSDQPGEGSTETNVITSAREDGQIDVSESAHIVGLTDGMADGIRNFNEEENDNDEEEMQGELLYVVQQFD